MRKKVSNFFSFDFSNRPLLCLVELLQNGECASDILTQLNNENEELKHWNKETNERIKHLSTDYCNLISKSNFLIKVFIVHLDLSSIDIIMELVETLQQAIVRKTITIEYIDNVCERLDLTILSESISNMMDSARLY